MTTEPSHQQPDTIPTGVVVFYNDGSRHPAEMAYSHTDDEGIRHFATTEVFDLAQVSGATCAVLPTKSAINVRAK